MSRLLAYEFTVGVVLSREDLVGSRINSIKKLI